MGSTVCINHTLNLVHDQHNVLPVVFPPNHLPSQRSHMSSSSVPYVANDTPFSTHSGRRIDSRHGSTSARLQQFQQAPLSPLQHRQMGSSPVSSPPSMLRSPSSSSSLAAEAARASLPMSMSLDELLSFSHALENPPANVALVDYRPSASSRSHSNVVGPSSSPGSPLHRPDSARRQAIEQVRDRYRSLW